jgi:HEAT repeat protein
MKGPWEDTTSRKHDTLRAAINLLGDKRSPRRRSGAKKLRQLGDVAAGAALLDALRAEVKDPRTWETQYQMIMALGVCRHQRALPFLRKLARTQFEASTLYLALGDAIVRLARKHKNDVLPVIECAKSGNDMLADGAFRAMAMLRMVPGKGAVARVIDFVSARPAEDPLRFWVVAAAPGWKGPKVERFLRECASNQHTSTRDAAADALLGKYRKWRPL